jgi:hypothetical protein
VLSRLQLLQRLHEVHLSPDEAWALVDLVTTPTSGAEDHECLARLMRATTAVTEHLWAAPAGPEPSSPRRLASERTATRKHQVAKAARRRQRRSSTAR